jgi:arginase family enzyme
MGPILNLEFKTDLNRFKIADGGDIQAQFATDAARILQEKASELFKRKIVPIVFGSCSFQSKLIAFGLIEAAPMKSGLLIVNVDSHLDLRRPSLNESPDADSRFAFQRVVKSSEFKRVGGEYRRFGTQATCLLGGELKMDSKATEAF